METKQAAPSVHQALCHTPPWSRLSPTSTTYQPGGEPAGEELAGASLALIVSVSTKVSTFQTRFYGIFRVHRIQWLCGVSAIMGKDK